MELPLKILIVEDSEPDSALMLRLLTESGYAPHFVRVETAEDLHAALDTQIWDAVISDYLMPGFSGPEALELVRAHDPNLPFIIVSGTVGEETVARMLKLGANDYIMKDRYTRLVPSLQHELQEAQSRREHLQIEKELTYERYLLRTLLENLPDRLYFKDLQSRFTLLSQSLVDHLGHTRPEAILGKTDFDFFTKEHAQSAYKIEQQIIANGLPITSIEEKETWEDGRVSWVNTSKMPFLDPDGKIAGTFGISSDVTRVKHMENLLQVRMRLQEYAETHSIHEMLVYVLDEVGEVTNSPIGFYHFVDEDQQRLSLQAWSTRTTKDFCTAAGAGRHYDIALAGVWADAVRERRAIIHNDYRSTPGKKGMPEGHAEVTRELVVPIFREGKIVSILGVGNKPGLYTRQDLEMVTYLADIAWTIFSRNRTEQELQRSEAHFRAVTESASDAIITIAQDGTIVDWNHSAQRIFGWEAVEILGQPASQLIPAEYHPIHEGTLPGMQPANRFGAAGKTSEMDAVHKNGNRFPVEISISEWETDQGRFSTAILRDISDRKQAELALRDEKERYRSLYDNVPVGLYRTTPDGHILLANTFLVNMLGYNSFEDLAQHNIGQDFRRRLEQKEWIQGYEESITRKDGFELYVRESGRLIRDSYGQPLYYEGTIEDITEIHATEQQNRRLVATVEQASEAMALSDSDGRVLYFNPAFQKMFQIDTKRSSNEYIYALTGLTLQPSEWQAILRAARSGRVWKGDIHTHQPDGISLEIKMIISPVSSPEMGKITGLGFVMSDVTQEKVAEIQSRQSQKMQAIGHLAAGIAHEINTPTQFIGNNLQFLQDGFQSILTLVSSCQQSLNLVPSSPEVTQAIERIHAIESEIDFEFLTSELPAAIDGSIKGIERISKIVSAMKEFSHPGNHEKVFTDLNHAIENTLVVTRNEWKYNSEIVTALDPDLPQIPCLVDEFNQVILNLITNAVDAIREAQAKNPPGMKGMIRISTTLEEPWVCVRISDNGTGIPEAIKERIFDPFFTTKEVGKGTGQGLSISYDVVVNKHGGTITFETESGTGTTFIIRIPAHPDGESRYHLNK